MTPVRALLNTCGLSIGEAAHHFGVRHDTIAAWAKGKNTGSDGHRRIVAGLIVLAQKIDEQADETLKMLQEIPPDGVIEIGFPTDDHEARAVGLPTASAWGAMIGRVLAYADRDVFLAPRGSTVATAAAIEARERR